MIVKALQWKFKDKIECEDPKYYNVILLNDNYTTMSNYHLKDKELPACCFSKKTEKTYDRSFKKFIEENS